MNDPGFRVGDACDRCGRCVADCVVRAIDMTPDGPALARPGDCLRCQHCFAICPQGAVSILGLSAADAPPNAPWPDGDAMARLIRGRRSVRRFGGENGGEVDEATLRDLIDTAWHAPTAVNKQGLHFAVVATRAAMDRVRARVYDRLHALLEDPGRAPTPQDDTIREFVADWRATRRDDVFRDAPHLVVVSASARTLAPATDAAIALSYLDLYAPTRGVGTVWCGFAMMALTACADRSLWRDVGVPRGFRAAQTMLLGRAAWAYPRGVARGPAPSAYVKDF